jgi:hypothetical protein
MGFSDLRHRNNSEDRRAPSAYKRMVVVAFEARQGTEDGASAHTAEYSAEQVISSSVGRATTRKTR